MSVKSLKRIILTSVSIGAFMGSAAHAGVMIAAQDFEGNTLANGITSNAEFNSPTEPGLVFDGSGLGWNVSFVDTRGTGETGPIDGNEGGDSVGVVNGLSALPDGNGTISISTGTRTGQWFHWDDVDGAIYLAFDAVDTAGFENVTLSFSWSATTSTYEPGDEFDISINAISVFNVAGDDLDTTIARNNFVTVDLDLSAFDGDVLNIVVRGDSNASAEDYGFDNLVIMGDIVQVNAPSTLALFGLGLCGLAGLRRRKG